MQGAGSAWYSGRKSGNQRRNAVMGNYRVKAGGKSALIIDKTGKTAVILAQL